MTVALQLGALGPAGLAKSATNATLSQTCAVRLIDRRTGQTHRINGSPLVVFTKTPDLAVAELLSGRDAAVWEARVEPISGAARKVGGRE